MKKLLKSAAVPLFCLLAGGALQPSARAVEAGKVQESTVRIFTIISEEGGRATYGSGSGFIVNENGNILTNQSVVDGAEQFKGVSQIFALRNVGGVTRLYRCKCEASQQSKDLDLAVLTSSIKSGYLPLNTVEPKPHAGAYASGFPGASYTASEEVQKALFSVILRNREEPALEGDGVDVTRQVSENKRLQDMVIPSFSTGQVKRMADQIFHGRNLPTRVIDTDIIPTGDGISGGPLLDATGLVIGVVFNEAGQNEAGQINMVPDGMGPDKDGKIHMVRVIGGYPWNVILAISESEIEKFLADRMVAFHKTAFDVAKMGHWTVNQKVLVSLASACAVIAAGLAFLMVSRRQPAPESTPASDLRRF